MNIKHLWQWQHSLIFSQNTFFLHSLYAGQSIKRFSKSRFIRTMYIMKLKEQFTHSFMLVVTSRGILRVVCLYIYSTSFVSISYHLHTSRLPRHSHQHSPTYQTYWADWHYTDEPCVCSTRWATSNIHTQAQLRPSGVLFTEPETDDTATCDFFWIHLTCAESSRVYRIQTLSPASFLQTWFSSTPWSSSCEYITRTDNFRVQPKSYTSPTRLQSWNTPDSVSCDAWNRCALFAAYTSSQWSETVHLSLVSTSSGHTAHPDARAVAIHSTHISNSIPTILHVFRLFNVDN